VSHYFLDSSALLKRYVVEPGSAWIRTITSARDENTILISSITPVEIVSGVMRRRREGLVTVRIARSLRLLIDRHASREYDVVGLTEQVVKRAQDLLEHHPLRAFDAIQLASALQSNERLLDAQLSPVTFVSADTRLLFTAEDEGLTTVDPNTRS
jgi:predicted nucleic acid-binding protein